MNIRHLFSLSANDGFLKMTTKDLCALLEELQYPEACPPPDSLSWAFEQDGARQVLKWLCSNLSQNNVLTVDELSRYVEMPTLA